MGDELSYFPSGPGGRSGEAGLTTLRKAEFIRGVEIFSHATVEDLYRVAGIARVVEFGPSSVVFSEDDFADTFYVLVEGSVEVASEERNTREVVGPGAALGLYSVLTRERRDATATALEPTVALSIAAEDLYSFLSNNMEIVVSIFKHFVKRLGKGPSA